MAVIEGAQYRTGANVGDSTGYGPFRNAGAPVNGTTLDNIAEKGALLIDTTNANLYVNAGTKADSVWKLVTRAA
jgi:hypothetical protein